MVKQALYSNGEKSKAKKEGILEAEKEMKKEEVITKKKLDELAKNSANTIFEAKTVFPFDLFPKTITIDKDKVSIHYKYFFGTEQIQSLAMDKLTEIRINTTPFFSSMEFEIEGVDINPPRIRFMRNEDALKARRIVHGLRTTKIEDLDIRNIKSEDLKEKLEEIGKAQE